MDLAAYELDGFYDEGFARPGEPRPGARILFERLASLELDELVRRQAAAERALLTAGITFNVYESAGSSLGRERIFPFDLVPRVIDAVDWSQIERGLAQRIRALNQFLNDVYNEGEILRAGVVPREMVESSKGYLPACKEIRPRGGIFCHVVGTDLVRDGDGKFYVLEDNLRCPSGVSYVLENRAVMKRTFPQAFAASRVRPVDEYPSRLLQTLQDVAPERRASGEAPCCVLLTPGSYNSAYFEHAYLAQQMGIELVEGRDLLVEDDTLLMKTTRGKKRVDVVYRRLDDDFLDPEVFRPDSLLGVPGLFRCYQRGNLTLANAPGAGVADDKALYTYVPDIIRFYLGEEPILPNVHTYLCRRPDHLAYVREHLHELVVKAVGESGGYGMLVGPASTRAEREEFERRLSSNPSNYIAQPTLSLSRAPTLVESERGVRLEGRHVDLRPYVLSSSTGPWVMPGGLTRVALRKGSLVVNSSQGGGSKDTWVLHAKGRSE